MQKTENDLNVYEENTCEINEEKKRQALVSIYTYRYRVIKTILLHLAYMSLGLNNELFGVSIEDLKILLNVNYQSIATVLVVKIIGYMFFVSLVGFVVDRLINYSDFLITIASVLYLIPSLLIPWLKIYWLALIVYLMQGIGQSLFDVCVNESVLRLWNGVSNSPISIAQAGYGIGGLMAVFISKPYIKFNPYASQNTLNSTNITINNQINLTSSKITSSDIKLQIPYSIAALFGLLSAISFLFAQYFEAKNRKKLEKSTYNGNVETECKQKLTSNGEIDKEQLRKPRRSRVEVIGNIVFSIESHETHMLTAKIAQISLVLIIFMCIGGYSITMVNFMLPFLTKGPAKLSLNTYFHLQIIFWALSVVSRLIIPIIAFKMNTLVFFTIVILFNLISALLYALPILNTIKSVYWLTITLLSLASGPIIPGAFMIAKHILIKINSVLVSSFAFSLAIGCIILQYLTGYLLDEFKPNANWFGYKDATSTYIVPFVILLTITICTFVYGILIIVNNRFKLDSKSMSTKV